MKNKENVDFYLSNGIKDKGEYQLLLLNITINYRVLLVPIRF